MEDKTARQTALEVLEAVFQEGAYSHIAVKQALDRSRLSQTDKGLVTEIVYGTVARKITLEWYLSHYISDRNNLDGWVYRLLMMSLYQHLYLDKIPDHAIVDEAVKIAKRKKGADAYVNALLRRLLSEDLPDIMTIKRENKRYSVQYSVPVWLVSRLIKEYGKKRAKQIFASLHTKNKISLRVINPDDKTDLMKNLGAKPSQLSDSGIILDKGYVAATEAFKKGLVAIQDETSQLVAPTLAIKGDEHILDACSAPGGKTMHMASFLTTGTITALDVHAYKLELIKENAKRLHCEDHVTCQVLDATQASDYFGEDRFDEILVDAPCSGTGLMRRKPDIKYHKEALDFKVLQEKQLAILDSVCRTLKKDGIITYSTCSIIREENQDVVDLFLESHPQFEFVPLAHREQTIMVEGCLLITPEQFGTDGFFISQIRRIS